MRIGVALFIGVLAFVYRFNALGGSLGGFDNDHFAHLVRAEHVMDGELPLRDFADAELRAIWPPLMYQTSAFSQLAFGESLRSEALITVGLLAVGAAVTCWVAADVAAAILPAALLTLVAVALSPNLYNYPKIVTYILVVAALVAYARRPTRLRLVVLAALVVMATLYRHDHGVFLGVSAAVVILLADRRNRLRELALFGAVLLVGLLPGLVFVQRQVGVIEYLRSCLEVSRQEANRTRTEPVFPTFDWSQPLLIREELPPTSPRVGVLWADTVTASLRQQREQVHGLARPIQRSERNWAYDATDPSAQRLAALVHDPLVKDTDGIDRDRFTILRAPEESRWLRWQRRVPLLQWRIAPGVLREGNAVPWLYLVAWVIVIGSLVTTIVMSRRRGWTSGAMPVAALAGIGTLGLLLLIVFLRNPIAARLPDVSVPITVLGSWLIVTIPRSVRSRSLVLWTAVSGLMIVAIFITVLATFVAAAVAHELSADGFTTGFQDVAKRGRSVWQDLGRTPAVTIGDDAQFARAVAYLRRCTAVGDRVFVGENAPQLYYFADRRFAAGHVALFSNFYSSQQDQRRAIQRWQRQSVPIALIQPSDRFSEEFGSDYPLLAAYLKLNYRRTGELVVDHGGRLLDVWIRNGRSAAIDKETGLPCFG